MTRTLPAFVRPMLAKLGEPFDSDEHLFEIKWDGFRALAFVEGGGYRLLSRRENDFTARYPEVDVLRSVPAGTVLDGELVLLRDGVPDFEALLGREQVRGPIRVESVARTDPVTFVAFDVLYCDFESQMDAPLAERRKTLARVLAGIDDPRLVVSEGTVGGGLHFFEEAGRMGFEGMVAKRLDSRYEAGRRTGAWTKCKASHVMLCAIVGYQRDEAGDVKSLIIATNDEDGLRCVGKVGSGLTRAMVARLNDLLAARRQPSPLIDCGMDGVWVAPGLYCKVRFLERTKAGTLRGPVFLDLVTE